MTEPTLQVGKLYPVILSGGAGTRLWPLSRQSFPKQLLALDSERSMLQETASRVQGADFAAPTIVCNDEHRFIVRRATARDRRHAPRHPA